MGPVAGNDEPQDEEKRWGQILQEIVDEQQAGGPWWQRLGISCAWAGGLAGAAAVVVALLLLIVELFKAGRQFDVETFSNWMFWAAALFMIGGLLAPSASGVERDADKDKEQDDPRQSRAARTMRRRIRRVYDPWRWRIWGAALLSFGFSVLVSLLAT